MNTLKEILIKNKVVFCHVRRTICDEFADDIVEDYLFDDEISSRFYSSESNEWLDIRNEKERGDLEMPYGTPTFNATKVMHIKNDNIWSISIPADSGTQIMKELVWIYSPEAKMLRCKWVNRCCSIISRFTRPFIKEVCKPEGDGVHDEIIEAMLFFEDNKMLSEYRKELEETDIPDCDKCKKVDQLIMNDKLQSIRKNLNKLLMTDNIDDNSRVAIHISLAEEFEKNKRYDFAAEQYYMAFRINKDDSLVKKIYNLLKIMEKSGQDIGKFFSDLDKFNPPTAFTFDTDKEETSIGDVEFANNGGAKGVSNSDIPEVGKVNDNFKSLTNYVVNDVAAMTPTLCRQADT